MNSIIEDIITQFIQSDRLEHPNQLLQMVAHYMACFLPNKDSIKYIRHLSLKVNSSSTTTAAYYEKQIIYIKNPRSVLPLRGIFLPISILNKMFLLVLVHEMVHAWQDYYAKNMTSCEAEAHANSVCIAFSKKFNMYYIFEIGAFLLETYYRFSNQNAMLEKLQECYLHKARKIPPSYYC